MSTFGHRGRCTYCSGENEKASPWPPYHTGRDFAAGASAVTLFAGEAPHGISDHASRSARALAGFLGWSMAIVGPEHARTLAGDGWSAEDLKRHLYESVRQPYRALLPDEDHGEGTNLRFGATGSRPEPETMIPKFPSTEEIHVVVADGIAGRFSIAIPGWPGKRNGSRPVTRIVE